METITQAPAAGSAPATPAPGTGAGEATPPSTAPASPQANRDSIKSLIAGMTPEQRRLAATGKLAQLRTQSTPAAAPAAPAATATPATTPPSSEATPASPAEAATQPDNQGNQSPEPEEGGGESPAGESGEGGGSKRFRFSDQKDVAIIQFAKAHGLTLAEAALRLNAAANPPTNSTPAAPGTKTDAPPPPAEDSAIVAFNERLGSIDTKIKGLVEERKKAIEALDSERQIELSDQISDLKSDRKLLERDVERYKQSKEQEAQAAVTVKVNESRAKALEDFPVLKKTGSLHALAFEAYLQQEYKNRPGDFSDVNWPYKFATEFAAANGIAKAGSAPAAPAATPPAATPPPTTQKAVTPTIGKQSHQQVPPGGNPGAKLLTGSDGRSPGTTPMTREDAVALARSDPKAMAAFLFKKNKPA